MKMSRRGFLRTSALLGAASVAASLPSGLMARSKEPLKGPAGAAATFRYRADGKFKILQFTDTHYISGDPRAPRALACVKEMLERERPDLVIHTGDMIFGQPAEQSIREILAPISESGVPFLVALGNHDGQFGLTRRQVMDIVRSVKGNRNVGVEGICGDSNDLVTLHNAAGHTDRALYIIDSADYIADSPERRAAHQTSNSYDYIHADQIAWYRSESERLQRENDGRAVPALAFFHIPVPEFNTALHMPKGRVMVGHQGEEPCSPRYNSGLWTQMRERTDVEAIFCGHDHDDDCALYYDDTLLCYGRYSGCDTVYNNLKPNGARVIELTQGQPGFRTWIRLTGGTQEQDYKFPDDFRDMAAKS